MHRIRASFRSSLTFFPHTCISAVHLIRASFRHVHDEISSLIHHLALFGYHPARHTLGLWQHETRDTIYTLVVDDFAIIYTSLDNAQHLLHALKEKYTISEDWEAKLYTGISLKWDYSKRTVDLSMPGYVTAALQQFRHQLNNTRQSSQHHQVPPTYGARV